MLETLPVLKFDDCPLTPRVPVSSATVCEVVVDAPASWFSNQGCGVTRVDAMPARICAATASNAWANVWPDFESTKKYGDWLKLTACGRCRAKRPAYEASNTMPPGISRW